MRSRFFLIACLVFGSAFFIVGAQNEGPPLPPPELLGINPTSPKPGETVEIIGNYLGNQATLTNLLDDSIYNLVLALNQHNTIGAADLADNIPVGDYRLIVIGSTGLQSNGYLITIQALVPPNGPTIPPANDFGDLIENIFTWALWLVGAAVFVNFLWAGFLWFTAAGRPGPIGQAKDKMFNSLIGAIILLASYIILNTINPDLVKQVFELPGL